MPAIVKAPIWYRHRLRAIGWGAALALLSLPAVATQAGAEGVHWTASDFLFFGIMLLVLGLGLEWAAKSSGDRFYRAAAAIALFGNFLLFWINAAVGIIGPESSASNLLFFAMPALLLTGAAASRGAANRMSQVMAASTVAQIGIGLFAVMLATGSPGASFGPLMFVTLAFSALWLLSAALFARAGRR